MKTFRLKAIINDFRFHEVLGLVALLLWGCAVMLSNLAVVLILLSVPFLACYVLGEC